MRRLAWMAVLAVPAASAAVQQPPADALDHVLLWGRNIDQVSAVMAVKLGLQVRPGRDPAGVANRYVRMADGSYIELEAITRADASMDPGMRADQAALHGGPGVRTFGLRSAQLDRRRTELLREGFAPTPVFSASPDDPDGDGPAAPPRWRLFAFERDPLSSHLFFIDYAALAATPARVADARTAREHPDGAQALSAIWLLSADAGADRRQLERMGFAGATPVRMPRLSAAGFCVPVGSKRVFVLQPDGGGIAADALRRGGPQVLGISVQVADLGRAQRMVERGYGTRLARYEGRLGEAFLAPTQGDLGMWVEFHASAGNAGAGGCMGSRGVGRAGR